MRKLLYFIPAFLVLPFFVYGAQYGQTYQVIMGISAGDTSGTSTIDFMGSSMQTDSTFTGARSIPVACAGTVSHLQVFASTTPAAGTSWRMALNSVAFGSGNTLTALGPTCDIVAGQFSCTDYTNSGVITAGQTVVLRAASSTNTIPASTTISFSALLAPETFNCTYVGAGGAVATAGIQVLQGFAHVANWSTLSAAGIARRRALVPMAGQFKGMYGKMQLTQTAPDGTSMGLRNETTLATSTIQIAMLSGTPSGSDTTNSTTTAQGVFWSFIATSTAASTNSSAAVSVGFYPSEVGGFMFSGGEQSNVAIDSSTLNTYMTMEGKFATTTLTEAQIPSPKMKILRFLVNIATAPGASASRTFSLMVNGATTSLACIISGASATSCTANATYTINDTDKVNFVDAPTGSPATNTYVEIATAANAYFQPPTFWAKSFRLLKGSMRIFVP